MLLKTKIVTIVMMVLSGILALPILGVVGRSLMHLMMMRTTPGSGGVAAVAGGIGRPILSLTIIGTVVIVLLCLSVHPRRR